MSDNSAIEWTEATWNPVTGCTKVSPGCDHCYAERIVERFKGKGAFAQIQLNEERLTAPLKWKRPRRIFVNSMSDLFHDQVPDEYIARVFAVMAATPQHTYQILTKRHGRMRSLLRDECQCHPAGTHFRSAIEWAATPHSPTYVPGLESGLYHRMKWPLPNVWLGVSVEDQKRADLRIRALLETPAAVRWLSCEPLLGPVDLRNLVASPRTRIDVLCGDVKTSDGEIYAACPSAIDWVVVGGESGPGARPMHPQWARDLRDQCTAAGVPFFFKQWGEWAPIQRPFDYVTDDDRCQVLSIGGTLAGRPWRGWKVQTGHEQSEVVRRYGKKAAGRELNGRTWDEYPTRAAVPA